MTAHKGTHRPPGRLGVGPGVYLDRPTASDRVEFLARVRASRSLHRSWVSPPADADGYRQYLLRNRRDDFEAFLARRRGDDALVGVANLSHIIRGAFQNAYVGFYGFAPYTGGGYMTEALDLVLRLAFRSLHLHRVEANIQPGNARSRALVQGLGFRLEGRSPRYLKVAGQWRDHERWAILSDEWSPSGRRGRGRSVDAPA